MQRMILYAIIGLLLVAWLLTRWLPLEVAEHPHEPSLHGGQIVSLAGDRYHVEVVQLADGTIKLFTLAADETQVLAVESQTLTAYVRAEGESTSLEVSFTPQPQPGDEPGETSCFVGQTPSSLVGRTLLFTLPSLRIGNERFRVAWVSEESHDTLAMPSGASAAEEAELYLTAAGRYTEADIAANGNQTASQRFVGFRPQHDPNPKPGDVLCPITRTRANPQCTWVVGGETYSFCCPPCIDEFVRRAKESPDEIEPPQAYVK